MVHIKRLLQSSVQITILSWSDNGYIRHNKEATGHPVQSLPHMQRCQSIDCILYTISPASARQLNKHVPVKQWKTLSLFSSLKRTIVTSAAMRTVKSACVRICHVQWKRVDVQQSGTGSPTHMTRQQCSVVSLAAMFRCWRACPPRWHQHCSDNLSANTDTECVRHEATHAHLIIQQQCTLFTATVTQVPFCVHILNKMS